MYRQKYSYYSTSKCEYNGHLYDSKFEAGYAQQLDIRLKAKDIVKWEAQKTLDLIVNGFKVCTYRIDFIVYYEDGTIEYVETKGYATPVWRLKWKLFEATYADIPGVRLLLVKQGKFNIRHPKKLPKELWKKN